MSGKGFTHLHLHTQYSLLDGAISAQKLFARCKELGMGSVAISDHGNMFGVVDFYTKALDAGIKPILGMEAYIAPESRFDRQKGGGDWNVSIGIDGGGNIDNDPHFADPNMTNYRLLPGSLCIDAGDNSSVTETDDLDGRIRIVDGDCDGIAVVDMGAYEFRSIDYGDFAGGCDVDFLDFTVLAASWQTNNPNIDVAPFQEPDGVIDIQELAILIENWLW